MQIIKRIFFFALTNIAVLALLSVVMAVIGYFFPWILEQWGGMVSMLIYAGVIGFGGAFISLLISRWSAKRMYNIQLIDSDIHDEKLQVVWNIVQKIALENNISMPEVGYYESSEPNAFATGASKNKSLVAVSTGLLNAMEKNEIEWVIGHEMAHILNGDMVTLTLIQWVVNTFVVFLANIAAKAIAGFLTRDDEWKGLGFLAYNAIYLLCQITFWFLANFVVMWFSRTREYRADLGWAKFTNKASMIAGLKKLQKITEASNINKSKDEKKMAAFMITEPDSMFSTHPSLNNRIQSLEENYQIA